MIRSLLILSLSIGLMADSPQDDPVMLARNQRARALGIDERDLPPINRHLIDPPPLPPIKTHPKDLKGYRGSGSKKHVGRRKHR